VTCQRWFEVEYDTQFMRCRLCRNVMPENTEESYERDSSGIEVEVEMGGEGEGTSEEAPSTDSKCGVKENQSKGWRWSWKNGEG